MCVFCDKAPLIGTDLAKCFYDNYPVTNGHLLVVPKRHVESYFELTSQEQTGLWALVNYMREYLSDEFNPEGFNVGLNDGVVAGQTILHAHVHLIPRYKGDMDDPAGGVRGVIPEKQKYERKAN